MELTPGPSEEFVEGHFDLLWSLVRDGHNSSSDSDSLKDLFRDAGMAVTVLCVPSYMALTVLCVPSYVALTF